ncbi:PorP/SprF family type IX secretion system membrane protein [Pedobacter sp. WC2423]|uniref:PorP/SprF family type IX secretion system membrane protein n=1 Tax=Pedobacter sp. WC2423 TaxID=3234142 RepID=UPI0034665EA8
MKRNIAIWGLMTGLFLFTAKQSKAQLNPLAAMYYQNQYLGNPAMVGIDRGLSFNLGYRAQWNGTPGSPVTQSVTGNYGVTDRMGLGINVSNDKIGLQRWTRAVGSYAYHLPLNGNGDQLHFGLSFGFSNERLNENLVNGDPTDVGISQYNQRSTYVDGDFGIAYTANRLTLQAALPNLKSVFHKNDLNNLSDQATFYTAASYRLSLSEGEEGVDVEPKVALRGVKGYKDIFDAGANLVFANKRVNVYGLYHSTESYTFGVGMQYQGLNLSGSYTSGTSALRGYVDGNFELSLRIRVF